MGPSILSTVALLLLVGKVCAFTTSPKLTRVSRRTFVTKPLSAESKTEEESDVPLVKSVEKGIAFDEKSGRFFETKYEETECIPDEEFCAIDKDTGNPIRLTLAEKERMFMDALQSYYVSGRKVLNDSDFDALKEDLTWNGSDMVVMNRKEAQYLAAVQDYLKGTPSMTDSEFDSLKKELMSAGSKFAVQKDPKCYVDTGICKVTLQEDKFRSNLLYLPAGGLITLLWLGLGYELIEPVIRLNPIVLTLLGTPIIFKGARTITENFLFEDKFVVYGPCPSCKAENRIYFGKILGVEGFNDVAEVKCRNCKEVITVQRNTLRASTLPKA